MKNQRHFLSLMSWASPLLLLIFSSCSYIERNTIGLFRDESQTSSPIQADHESPKGQEIVGGSAGSQRQAESHSAQSASKIEIIWAIPENPVDAYVINYGLQPHALDQKLRLKIEQIERFEDEDNRAVFRYVLTDVPSDKTVYLAIAADVNGQLTPLSEVQEVKP